MENLARQFYRDHKKVLALIKSQSCCSGFEPAVYRLFGDNPIRGATANIGGHEFRYSNLSRNLLSFLPETWCKELEKVRGAWSGCQNWWAGYPFITWIEMRAGDDGIAATLILNAEIGPISNHKVRTGLIGAVKAEALARGLERVQFSAGATDKGRLYSRFFRQNSVKIDDIRNTNLVELRLMELITGFASEFELVSSVIPSCFARKRSIQTALTVC